MHKPTMDEREQLMSIKICVVLEKKSGDLEGCFFKSCLVCQGKKEEKKSHAFCMWFVSENTHTAHHTDLKRQKCCSKTLPEREFMGTKPQWTKSPWIISSSELICRANINIISADPWVSSFSSYTEFFEGQKLVTAFSRSELGEKKNWEKPNESRNHFFSLCVSKQHLGMARMTAMMLSVAFIRLFQKHCSPGSQKVGLSMTACCAVSICHISSWSTFTEKGRSEGPVIALCTCSGCLHSKTVLLKNFICPNCSSAQSRQEVAHGSLEVKRLHIRVWPRATVLSLQSSLKPSKEKSPLSSSRLEK